MMKFLLQAVFVFLVVVLFSSCAARKELVTEEPVLPIEEIHTKEAVEYIIDVPSDWVESTLQKLSLEEKVAQMIMARSFSHYISEDTDQYQELLRLVQERKIGGIAFFQGDVSELALLTNELQYHADIPLLFAADFERGIEMRLRRGTIFPVAMAVGATRDHLLSYRMGKAIAKEGRALGIHQNFAPVVDVNNNPNNPVINVRSFGEDPLLVSEMADAFINGLHDGGMISTAKHFPGHGDTEVDSHIGLPVISHNRQRLESVEFVPFKHVISGGVLSIMTAHIAMPGLTGSAIMPATLSRKVVHEILRDEMDFSGLIVTDAMEMEGITKLYPVGTAAVKAVQAGADIVLLPPNVDAAIESIVAAVQLGEIPEEQIDASVRRILAVKNSLNLPNDRFVDVSKIRKIVRSREHVELAKEIARRSITLVRNNNDILPISQEARRRTLVVIISDQVDQRVLVNRPESPAASEPVGNYFLQVLRQNNIRPDVVRVDPRSNKIDYDSLLRKVEGAELIIGALYVQARSGQGRIGVPDTMLKVLQEMTKKKAPVVMVSFGDPYFIRHLPHIDAYLCAYHSGEFSVEAAVETLLGSNNPTGNLPVTIPDIASFGTGLNYGGIEVSTNALVPTEKISEPVRNIERLINASIDDGAFPGAVVIVGDKRNILYQSAFGRLTYHEDAPPVTLNTIYDLASLTKAVATTTAIKHLYDNNKIELDSPVGDYIPEFNSSDKSAITIRHLLTHTSGFPPFKEYYRELSSPDEMMQRIIETPLDFVPGEKVQYSDIGMIVLGKIVERKSGKTLDMYLQEHFFEPLGMYDTMFNPSDELKNRIAPTEVDTLWRNRLIHGEVHDENAYAMGGVAGHAGLFSTVLDLSVFAQLILNEGSYNGRQFLNPETISYFISSDKTSKRGLGWDIKSETGYSSAGTLFSSSSFGHTGFTGTSLWIDPERNLYVIFLTNRVHPTRANTKIIDVRPTLHDYVIMMYQQYGKQ